MLLFNYQTTSNLKLETFMDEMNDFKFSLANFFVLRTQRNMNVLQTHNQKLLVNNC